MNQDTIKIERSPKPETDLDAQEKPLDEEEQLEKGLADSMDASDPPSATTRGDHGDPVPSSGFHEENEEESGKTK